MLVPITRSQVAVVASASGSQALMPALLTRMSRPPSAAAISATASTQALPSARSKARTAMSSPSARSRPAACSSWASPRAVIQTFAPDSAIARAISKPRPREAPVTMATWPSREKRFFISVPYDASWNLKVADRPPSTLSTWPLTKSAAGEARKTIAPTISSGLPQRSIGVIPLMASM